MVKDGFDGALQQVDEDDLFYFVLVKPGASAEVRVLLKGAKYFDVMKEEAGMEMAEPIRYPIDRRYVVLCDEEALIRPNPTPNRFGIYNAFVVVGENGADFASLGRQEAVRISNQINGMDRRRDQYRRDKLRDAIEGPKTGGQIEKGDHWANIKKRKDK